MLTRLLLLLAALLPTAPLSAEPLAEDVRSIVMRSLKSWETLDEKAFIETAHPDLLFAYPGQRTDRQGALQVYRMWKEKFRDTKVYVKQILVEDSRFAVEYQFATTSIASGKRTAMGTTAVGEIRDGKIVLLKEYTDSQVDDLQREGKLPLDEGAEPFPWPLPTLKP
jgi:ketosteroid isomerase-like protein